MDNISFVYWAPLAGAVALLFALFDTLVIRVGQVMKRCRKFRSNS